MKSVIDLEFTSQLDHAGLSWTHADADGLSRPGLIKDSLRSTNPQVRQIPGRSLHQDLLLLDQFLCMAFAQLTYRESLRDIVDLPAGSRAKLYHVGLPRPVSRSTLADANEVPRLAHLRRLRAGVLIARARRSTPARRLRRDLDQTVYAFDSTTIDLCLSLFPWASSVASSRRQAAHADRPARQYPLFHAHFQRQMADVQFLDDLADRARRLLHHGSRLHRLRPPLRLHAERGLLRHPSAARISAAIDALSRRWTRPPACAATARSVSLVAAQPQDYPDPLRRIRYYDAETRQAASSS